MKKFNELLMEDWYDALLSDKALDGFSQAHFESMPPLGLLQLGYKSWLSYLCRTEVPENYQGRALEDFLTQGEHLRPHQGPHPLLCGYNPTALRLYAQYQALPSASEDASRLMNHWSMGLERGMVTEGELETAKIWLEVGGLVWSDSKTLTVPKLKKELAKIEKAKDIRDIEQRLFKEGFGHCQTRASIGGIKGNWSLLTAVLAKFSEPLDSISNWWRGLGLSPVDRQLLFNTRLNEHWTGLGLAYHRAAVTAQEMGLSPSFSGWHRFRKEKAGEPLKLWKALVQVPKSKRGEFEDQWVNHRQFSLSVELPILSDKPDESYTDPWTLPPLDITQEVEDKQLLDILDIRRRLWLEVWSGLPVMMKESAVNAVKNQCYEDELSLLTRLGNRFFDGEEAESSEGLRLRSEFALYMHVTGISNADLTSQIPRQGGHWVTLKVQRENLQKTAKFIFQNLSEEAKEQALKPWVEAYVGHESFQRDVDGLAHDIPAELLQRFKSEALKKYALEHVKRISPPIHCCLPFGIEPILRFPKNQVGLK